MNRSRVRGGKAGDRLRRRRWPIVEGDDPSDIGWVEYGGELIWAVGYTAGGAPFGLRASELDAADLSALGLPTLSTESLQHADGSEAPGEAR
jgi:hypothetical protein